MRSILSIFSFRGRAQRMHYWIFFCISFGAHIALSVPLWIFGMQHDKAKMLAEMRRQNANAAKTFETILSVPQDFVIGLLIAVGVVILVLYIVWIALCVRRFHDMNVTGWLVLLCIVVALFPYLGYLLVSLVLGAWPGTKGANRYGPDPRHPLDVADLFGPDGTIGTADAAR